MIELTNGIKPSEVKVQGTYIVLTTSPTSARQENPCDHVRIIDVWLDARGTARWRNDNRHLPELLTDWPGDKNILFGPIAVPQITK